jgi:ribosomal protein L37E
MNDKKKLGFKPFSIPTDEKYTHYTCSTCGFIWVGESYRMQKEQVSKRGFDADSNKRTDARIKIRRV